MHTTARRWESAFAILGAVGAAVFVLVAALTAIPPSLANLASVTSAGESFDLGADAAVTVPAGWTVTRTGDAIRVRTPDGGMQADLAVDEEGPAEALRRAAERSAPDAALGIPRTEVLSSGATVVHADLPDAVVAALGETPAGPSVTVVAWAEAEMEPYRPALAELLGGIGFS